MVRPREMCKFSLCEMLTRAVFVPCRPLLDFLLLILFLPSLLTLLTVLSARVRQLRQQKRDRAPAEAVARLPIFLWQTSFEKPAPAAATAGDEESAVGSAPAIDIPTAEEPTEHTSLLHETPPAPRSLLDRARALLPGHARLAALAKLDAKMDQPLSHRPRWGSQECPICLCDFEKGERVMELPCGHLVSLQVQVDEVGAVWLTGTCAVPRGGDCGVAAREQEASESCFGRLSRSGYVLMRALFARSAPSAALPSLARLKQRKAPRRLRPRQPRARRATLHPPQRPTRLRRSLSSPGPTLARLRPLRPPSPRARLSRSTPASPLPCAAGGAVTSSFCLAVGSLSPLFPFSSVLSPSCVS